MTTPNVADTDPVSVLLAWLQENDAPPKHSAAATESPASPKHHGRTSSSATAPVEACAPSPGRLNPR
ncbi:hypothetical protein LUR56_40170 [Streptomyces sp. MT29]|nr:hypothetical protein [Streptomyces sp. MT29]